jgi:hypothetical protein
VGLIFVFQGAFELFFAFEMRPHPGWAGMLISGIARIVMGNLCAGAGHSSRREFPPHRFWLHLRTRALKSAAWQWPSRLLNDSLFDAGVCNRLREFEEPLPNLRTDAVILTHQPKCLVRHRIECIAGRR